jgi:hypothetical protein
VIDTAPDSDDRPTLPSVRAYARPEMEIEVTYCDPAAPSLLDRVFPYAIAFAVGLLIGALLFGCSPKPKPAAPQQPALICNPNVYETKCL